MPKEAVIHNIKFVAEFSEVYIEALKPGLVIGKRGSNLKAIAMQTNWTPKVLRTPTMASDTLTRVRQLMFNEAEFRKKFLWRRKADKQSNNKERMAKGNSTWRLQGGRKKQPAAGDASFKDNTRLRTEPGACDKGAGGKQRALT